MGKGRPTKFNDALKDAMLALYKQGRTDSQVAKAIGVTPKTLRNWRGKHPSFGVVVQDMKNVADAMVEASLFARATGYSHPEDKFFQYEGMILKERTTKHYPPDVQAAQFWLKNRQPKRWRDKTEVETSGEINIKMTLAERMARARSRAAGKPDDEKED